MKPEFSVVIPLYNKRPEIEATLRSVAGQSYPATEIIVVDDGSTDGSVEVVEAMHLPNLIIVREPNSGVSMARNAGITHAGCEYIALLDADDHWHAGYLAEVARCIEKYPGCGMYITGLNIVSKGKKHAADSPSREGIIEDYFRLATEKFICVPSCVTVSREAFERLGGFPEGMKLGEDQYMWVKLIDAGYKACYTPRKLCDYVVSASNRSNSTYKPEHTKYAFSDFYREGDFYRNEYLARIALNKAITLSGKGDRHAARGAARFYGYTRLNRRALRRLRIMNRLPLWLRRLFVWSYDALAWALVKKGF